MKIKINCKKLFGIDKTVTIKPTLDLIVRGNDLQVIMGKMDNLDLLNNDNEKAAETAKALHQMLDFVQSTLELTDKDMEYIRKNISMDNFGLAVGYIFMRLEGYDDEQIKEAQRNQKLQTKAMRKNPKKSKNTKRHAKNG